MHFSGNVYFTKAEILVSLAFLLLPFKIKAQH